MLDSRLVQRGFMRCLLLMASMAGMWSSGSYQGYSEEGAKPSSRGRVVTQFEMGYQDSR